MTRITQIVRLAVAALVAVGSAAHASEMLDRADTGPAVLSGFLSWHNTSKYDAPEGGYNQTNVGIGYRRADGWAVGYYHNSFRRESFYVAREWQWHVTDNLRVGAIAALATGYRSMKILPAVMPEIVYKAGASEFAVLAAPAVNADSPGMITLQYRLNLD